MKRVLGIVGSPRRNGNTHVLVERVLEGARQQGAAVECVMLGELTIRECDGCHVCWSGKACCKDDDMGEIYRKIAESDVLVLGTPVYWYGPTALMKALVDRMVYFNCPENRGKIAGKSAAIVAPFEEPGVETAGLTVAFFEKCLAYLQVKLAGRLIVPGVSERGDVLRKPERLREAVELGAALAGNRFWGDDQGR